MSLLGSLLAAATTKAGASVAALAVATGGAGVVAATGNLPETLQVEVDERFQSEQQNDRAEEAEDAADQREAGNDVTTADDGESHGEAVSEAVRTARDEAEAAGEKVGPAVSHAARTANGSAARVEENRDRAEERKAAAAERRAAARANAGPADADTADTGTGEGTGGRPGDAGRPEGAGGGRPDTNG